MFTEKTHNALVGVLGGNGIASALFDGKWPAACLERDS
jgi:hypothetical protein